MATTLQVFRGRKIVEKPGTSRSSCDSNHDVQYWPGCYVANTVQPTISLLVSLYTDRNDSMRNLPHPLRLPAAAAAMLIATAALGHGDTELPLYVAVDGVDTGDCLEAANPCGSIGYALNRAGKGSQIRIAEGTYEIENAEDVFHLVSGAIEVSGGYKAGAGITSSAGGTSLLTGVPYEYRELLESRGFQVIRDRKGIDTVKAAEASKLLSLHQSLKSSIAATPCTGGSAAGLPCSNVDLLSHVGFQDISAAQVAGNDIWGFVDLNTGREYAIVGFSHGTAVFDVTDGANPLEVGVIDGQGATWRDIKVYQHFDTAADRWKAYAYVTTDGSTDGLFVIDLTGLPHSVRRASYASDITSAHNVYATNTDYSTGISLTGGTPTLVIAGSNLGIGAARGKFRNYSLANPVFPGLIPGSEGTGYMHDASSIIITDSRKDTQCGTGGAFCEVLLDFNENAMEIWDITNSSSPRLLSSRQYQADPSRSYVHSGWWSEDKQYVFVHDEFDERNGGGGNPTLPTTLRIYSIADLTSPTLVNTWTGPTDAIDHNGFVRGNRYYMSNYARGLTVLDITDAVNPVEVGRLDTYPFSDATRFDGAWGAYPFFYSGNIAISDINSGFYMAADQTRDVPEGSLQFSANSYATIEGQQAQLVIERSGSATGSVSVEYEILHATANASDYSTTTGTLSWANGVSTDRTIDISAANDGIGEPMERLIVRLINPTGGATLGNLSTASAYLSDPGSTSEVSFSTASVNMPERGFATVVAVVRRSGSAVGAVSVDVSISGSATSGSDYLGAVPATLNWADGDGEPKLLEFSVVDDGVVEGDETLNLSLSNVAGATIGATPAFTATIKDGSGNNGAPNAIAGPSQTRSSGSQVTLNGNQSNDPDGDVLTYQWTQTSGQTVTLSNASTAIASFTAPTVSSDAMLQFQLSVSDPNGLSDSATTVVTVTSNAAPPTGGSGGGGIGLVSLLLLGGAAARRRISRTDGS